VTACDGGYIPLSISAADGGYSIISILAFEVVDIAEIVLMLLGMDDA